MDSGTEGQSYNEYHYLQQPSKTKFTDLSVTQNSTLTVKQRKLDLNVDPATTNTSFSMGKIGNNVQSTTTNTCFSIGKLGNNVDPSTRSTCFSVGKLGNNVDPTTTNTDFSMEKLGNNTDTMTKNTGISIGKPGNNADATIPNRSFSVGKLGNNVDLTTANTDIPVGIVGNIDPTTANTAFSMLKPGNNLNPTTTDTDISVVKPGDNLNPTTTDIDISVGRQIFNKCFFCGKEFVKAHALSRHMEICQSRCPTLAQRLQLKVNKEKCCKVYKCLSCSEFFYQVSSLELHIKEKHPYICRQCEKRFTHASQLIKHQRNHGIQNTKRASKHRLKCYLCKTIPSFQYTSDLDKHRKERHSPPYHCCFCQQTFVDIQVYDAHIGPHIEAYNTGGYSRENREKCQCPVCLNVFSPITTLERHMEIHANRFPCEYCYHSFEEHSVLTEHTENKHKGFTPYKCVACEETFPSRSDLTSHKIMNHMGDKQYQCFKCGLSFCQALELNDHMKVHKNATIIYKCKYCSQTFNEKTRLMEHTESSHTGERHKCVTCDETFMHISDLITHQKTHMARNMYKCFKCSLSFSHALELNEHMKVHKHSESVNSLQIMHPGSLGQNIILIKPELESDTNNHCNTADINPNCDLNVLVTPQHNTDEVIMVIKPDYNLDTTPDIPVYNVKPDSDLVTILDIPVHSIKPNYDLDNIPNITIDTIKPDYDLETPLAVLSKTLKPDHDTKELRCTCSP